VAGGSWPSTALVAAVTLVTEAKRSTPSLGVRLLGDLHKVFGQSRVMFTNDVIRELIALDESPWGDLRGQPITPRRLAMMLRQYDVESTTVRDAHKVAKVTRPKTCTTSGSASCRAWAPHTQMRLQTLWPLHQTPMFRCRSHRCDRRIGRSRHGSVATARHRE
jgi:hypothetical protein